MKTYRGIIFVIVISILASVGTAWMNGLLFQTSFNDWSDDSQYYNARALSLIHTGSLGEEQAQFRRPPAYPLFLAAVYWAFGEHIIAVWVVQMFLFALSLILIWRISVFFLEGWHALLPPFFTGTYWGFHFYVFIIGSEILASLLLLFLLMLFFWYRDDQRAHYLLVFGVAGGILALTKPITLYLLPVLLGGMAYAHDSWKVPARCFSIGLLPIIILVGGWTLRTYALFGEVAVERSGHILYTRALYTTLSAREMGVHGVASIAGDHVADFFFPGYGANPMPQQLGLQRISAALQLQKEGYSRIEAEQVLLRRGIALVQEHPVKFAVGAVPLLFDLNTPENISGFPITRMFVGTREYIAPWQKIIILAGVRIFWFLFLALTVAGAVTLGRTKFSQACPLLFLVLFFNLSHAFLIIPPEPRFLVPVVPLYFLFFSMGIREALTRVIKIRSIETT